MAQTLPKRNKMNGSVVTEYYVSGPTNEIHELLSNQEETDTRTVLYLKYAAKLRYKSAVVRTPETDIFFILLHHAQSIALTVFLDIGTGKHRQP